MPFIDKLAGYLNLPEIKKWQWKGIKAPKIKINTLRCIVSFFSKKLDKLDMKSSRDL